MKTLVVEGHFEAKVIRTLFGDGLNENVCIRVGMGFSNVISISKTLIYYGVDVLMVLDTDTDSYGHDNRQILSRLYATGAIIRNFKIAWMDPCMEHEIQKLEPEFDIALKNENISTIIEHHREQLLSQPEFDKIRKFIFGST